MTKQKLTEIINQLPENVFNKYALKFKEEIHRHKLVEQIKKSVKEKGFSNIMRSGVPKNTLANIISENRNKNIKIGTLIKVESIAKKLNNIK